MALTEYQIREWAEQPIIDPVVLVHAYNSVQLVYMSDRKYIDSASNIPYDNCLSSSISIQDGIGEQKVSSIRVNNDGSLDDWDDREWVGYDIIVFIGDKSWPANDFKRMFKGTIKQVANTNANQWEIVAAYDAEAALPSTVVTLGSGNNFALMAGNFNGQEAQYHYSTGGVKYYTMGDTELFHEHESYVSHNGTQYQIQFDHTVPNTFKLVGLDSPTSTVFGYQNTDKHTFKSFIQKICDRASVTLAQAVFDQLPDYPIQGKFRDANTTFKYVIEQMLQGIGGFYRFNPEGQLELFKLQDPTTVSEAWARIRPSDIKNIVFHSSEKRLKTLKYKYRIDHYNGANGSIGTLNNTIPPGVEYTDLKEINSMIGTNVVGTVSGELLALRNKERKIYRATITKLMPHLKVGDVIEIKHEAPGWRDWRKATIIGLTFELTNNRTELYLWR